MSLTREKLATMRYHNIFGYLYYTGEDHHLETRKNKSESIIEDAGALEALTIFIVTLARSLFCCCWRKVGLFEAI